MPELSDYFFLTFLFLGLKVFDFIFITCSVLYCTMLFSKYLILLSDFLFNHFIISLLMYELLTSYFSSVEFQTKYKILLFY